MKMKEAKQSVPSESIDEREMFLRNRAFYEKLWGDAELVDTQKFNTWPLVGELVKTCPDRVEIAPGLRPRLPVAGTHFVDISTAALSRLSETGGYVSVASICDLPFDDDSFDLVCALDIIEHVDDDQRGLSEMSRVARKGAYLLISSPLHPEWWTPFDEFVGHCRRYKTVELVALLNNHG